MVVVETKDLVTDTHTWITYDRQQLLVSHKKLKCMCINPFAPELPVTARADPGPFYPL